MEEIHHCHKENTNQRKVGIKLLCLDRVEFKAIAQNGKVKYLLIKGKMVNPAKPQCMLNAWGKTVINARMTRKKPNVLFQPVLEFWKFTDKQTNVYKMKTDVRKCAVEVVGVLGWGCHGLRQPRGVARAGCGLEGQVQRGREANLHGADPWPHGA